MTDSSNMVAAATAAFHEVFGDGDGIVAARAPGRVNMIGEHTDYNDGFVFPIAIDREMGVVGRRVEGDTVTVHAVDYGETNRFELTNIESVTDMRWSNYIRGVIVILQQAGYEVGGFQAAFAGNVPLGAGLSSSAALEVATITLLDALFDLDIDPVERALLGQKAENEFVGVACGIMDQFISSAGKQDHALFLDCRSLDYELVPMALPGHSIVVVNTNKRRGLVDSEYNTRRAECEEATRELANHLPAVKALRDVSVDDFEKHAWRLAPRVQKRARHVVTECDRVLRSVDALKTGDLAAFGQLMDASHRSLQEDFEVSCFELDTVVNIARQTPGVIGARMTGAGFGGCAVVVVEDAFVGEFIDRIHDQYPKATGLRADVYVVKASDGAGVVGDHR